MAIEFITINGKNEHLDYNAFESDLKNRLRKTCKYAKVYLYNNFPVVVTEESLIDLLIIIAIKDIYGNYYRVRTDSGLVYVKNLILPIQFIDGYKNQQILIEDGDFIINESIIRYNNEVNGIKYRLQNYLNTKCGFDDRQLSVHPLFFVQHPDEMILKHHLTGNKLTFQGIERYLKAIFKDRIYSTQRWKKSNEYDAYEKVTKDIKVITERASLDSQIGYLTKQKIDRIGRKVSRSSKMDVNLNKNLIIINGKAGTGKTTELLTLLTKTLKQGNNGLFLTYNKMLVFDLSRSIKAIGDNNKTSIERFGEVKVITLHQFFYRVAKSLGVLHIMSEDRINEVRNKLTDRLFIIENYIKNNEKNKYLLSEPDILLENIQNNPDFDIGTKEVGIDLVRFIRYKTKTLVNSRDEILDKFYNKKDNSLKKIVANEVFLTDYYGVLKNTLNQIENPSEYFYSKGIKYRHDLLKEVLNLKNKDLDEYKKIKKEAFLTKGNRKIGGFRRARTLFVDEAQDCHYLEKDILIKIFGSEHVVVANGGTEQLIRHMELCNWEYSQGRNLNSKKFRTKNRSYRVKEHLLEFCMFVAKKYNIDLNLEPYKEKVGDNPDLGRIIIDFKDELDKNYFIDTLYSLNEGAKIHGCVDYESTIVMINHLGHDYSRGKKKQETGIVNEYDNVQTDHIYNRVKLNLQKFKDSVDKPISFWNGTLEDKTEFGIPTSGDIRFIFYESCRGLEAWNAMCFSIDKFFEIKYNEEDAEKYLVGNEAEVLTSDLFLSNEDRKKMYAATWVLMAITRAMDSLYLHIEDRESEFGKTVTEFIETSPTNTNVIDNN